MSLRGNRMLYGAAMHFRPVKFAIASSPLRPFIAMTIFYFFSFRIYPGKHGKISSLRGCHTEVLKVQCVKPFARILREPQYDTAHK